MLEALPTLLMFTPYWTMPVLCGHHTISIIYLKLRWFKEEQCTLYDWNSSVTDMLQHLHWEQLHHQRDNFRAIEIYKIINSLMDIDLSEVIYS